MFPSHDQVAFNVGNKVVYTSGDTSIDATNLNYQRITNSAPTTITSITPGYQGQELVLYFADANTTITRAAALLENGVNYTSSTNDVVTFVYSGSAGAWIQKTSPVPAVS